MSREFAAKLLERVVTMFLVAFVLTYVNVLLGATDSSTPLVGQLGGFLQGMESLSLFHKAVLAGTAAVIQMILLVLVGPRVGDPNSPDIVPNRFLQHGQHEPAPVGRYAASDELQHLLQQAAAANPNAPLTTESVAAAMASARENTATSVT